MNAGPVCLDGVDPVVVDILIPPPAVDETAAARQALGVGVEVPVLVERWIGVDEINGAGVDALKEREVVAVE